MSAKSIVLLIAAALVAIVVQAVGVLVLLFFTPASIWHLTPSIDQQAVGYAQGQPITMAELRCADREARAISALGLADLSSIAPEEEALWWALVKHEARASQAEADPDVVEQTMDQITGHESAMNMLRERFAMEQSDIRQLMTDWFTAVTYLDQLAEQAMPDSTQLDAIAHELAEQAAFGLTPIVPARNLAEDPTDDQVMAQFRAYRDQAPGESEPYGFGYRLPPRVKLEYLMIPASQLRRRVAAELDEERTARYYHENPDQFTVAESDEPLPYAEVRDLIRDRLLDEQVSRVADQISAWLTHDLPPEAHQVIPLDKLAGQIKQRFDLMPKMQRLDERFLAIDEIASEPGLGRAMLDPRYAEAQRLIPMAQYLASCRELEPPEDHPLAHLELTTGTLSLPLRGMDGGVYVFQVLAARPGQAPDSIDPVRDQVIDDLQKLNAYRKLLAELDGRPEAVDQLSEDQAFVDPPVETGPISRRLFEPMTGSITQAYVPEIGSDSAFLDGIFALTEGLTDQDSFEQMPDGKRRTLVPSDRQLTVYHVELLEWTPADDQELERAMQWATMAKHRRALVDLITMEAVSARADYQPVESVPKPTQ